MAKSKATLTEQEYHKFLDYLIDCAEEVFIKNGKNPDIWKCLLPLKVAANQVLITFSKEQQKKLGPVETFSKELWIWARVSAIAHSAYDCKDIPQVFAYGSSIRTELNRLDWKAIVHRSSKNKSKRGGRNKLGKQNNFNVLVKWAVTKRFQKNKSIKIYDLIELFTKMTPMELRPFEIAGIDNVPDQESISIIHVKANGEIKKTLLSYDGLSTAMYRARKKNKK